METAVSKPADSDDENLSSGAGSFNSENLDFSDEQFTTKPFSHSDSFEEDEDAVPNGDESIMRQKLEEMQRSTSQEVYPCPLWWKESSKSEHQNIIDNISKFEEENEILNYLNHQENLDLEKSDIEIFIKWWLYGQGRVNLVAGTSRKLISTSQEPTSISPVRVAYSTKSNLTASRASDDEIDFEENKNGQNLFESGSMSFGRSPTNTSSGDYTGRLRGFSYDQNRDIHMGTSLFYHIIAGFFLGAQFMICIFLFIASYYFPFFLQPTVYLFFVTSWHFLDICLKAQNNPDELFSDGAYFPIMHWKYVEFTHFFAIMEYTFFYFLYPSSIEIRTLGVICGSFLSLILIWVRYAGLTEMGSVYSSKTDCCVNHFLVTTGVFKYSRHPLCASEWWFLLCIQLMLLNPISAFVFPFRKWISISNRIIAEEKALVKEFSRLYEQYRMKTPILIPFL